MMKFALNLVLMGCLLCFAPYAKAGVSEESALSLQASQSAVNGDYQKAITIYNKLIQIDPRDANHYIQRALMYRQIKHIGKSKGDAAMAFKLADYKLQKKSSQKRMAKYYWQRAMANRLLEQYDAAIGDMKYAMQLRGDQRWMADLQAIVLESRMYRAAR